MLLVHPIHLILDGKAQDRWVWKPFIAHVILRYIIDRIDADSLSLQSDIKPLASVYWNRISHIKQNHRRNRINSMEYIMKWCTYETGFQIILNAVLLLRLFLLAFIWFMMVFYAFRLIVTLKILPVAAIPTSLLQGIRSISIQNEFLAQAGNVILTNAATVTLPRRGCFAIIFNIQ